MPKTSPLLPSHAPPTLSNRVAALQPPARHNMSRLSLRKQSLPVAAHAPAPAGQASTPWDAATRASVPDFSSFLEHAQSHCPHLLAPPVPPLPAATFPTPRSSIAQLLRLTSLQAELEERRLAAYRRHISEEHATLVSSQSLDEQLALQQLLLAHLRALIEEGADGGLASHMRHVAACPSVVLDGLTSEQQTSARFSTSTTLHRAYPSPHCQSERANVSPAVPPSGALLCGVSVSAVVSLFTAMCGDVNAPPGTADALRRVHSELPDTLAQLVRHSNTTLVVDQPLSPVQLSPTVAACA